MDSDKKNPERGYPARPNTTFDIRPGTGNKEAGYQGRPNTRSNPSFIGGDFHDIVAIPRDSEIDLK